MLIDGVCIRWRGWIDLQRLDGNGCLEYDEERGRLEDAILKEQIEQYKMRMREFEERQRLYKLAQAEHQKKTATATAPTPANMANTGNISKSEVSQLDFLELFALTTVTSVGPLNCLPSKVIHSKDTLEGERKDTAHWRALSVCPQPLTASRWFLARL